MDKAITSVFAGVMLGIACTCAYAERLPKDIRIELAAGHYDKASHMLEVLAKNGDAEAQLKLGAVYVVPEWSGHDCAKGVQWIRMAAQQGSAEAQSFLGYMYTQGMCVEKSERRAKPWLEAAAKQGYQPAKVQLAFLTAGKNDLQPELKTVHGAVVRSTDIMTEYGGWDLRIWLDKSVAGCRDGAWIRKGDKDFGKNFQIFVKSEKEKLPLTITMNVNQRWPGTAAVMCNVQSVAIEHE